MDLGQSNAYFVKPVLNGQEQPPILEAYELDGTLLWRINLGINIREGESLYIHKLERNSG